MTTTSTSSATGSATSNLISALGAGSGINMAALATDLAAAQFAGRIDRLAAKSDVLDAQISAASTLKSMMLSLSTSLGERVRTGDLSPQPALDNGDVARAALSGSRTPSGTYSLEVVTLARAQILAAAPVASRSDPVGAGTITLRFGAVAGGVLTEDAAHTPIEIAIAAGATIGDVADAINAADAGVTAYVADTVDGPRLVMKGAEGAQSGFVLDVAEDAASPGLSALAWRPGDAGATLTQAAGDAAFRIDGLAMTASSNTVTDRVPGVTLTLTATNSGVPTSLRFADAAEAITGAMQDLTAALNDIVAALNEATDPKTGELARDAGARSLSRGFSALAGTVIMPGVTEDGVRTLSDLGLKTNRDGTFTLDSKRLSETLANSPDEAAAMFTTGLHGIYATIDGLSRRAATTGDPGSLAGSIARYTTQLSDVTEDQSELVEKQEALRSRLVARFAASDSRISASQSTLTFLQGQITAWNKSE